MQGRLWRKKLSVYSALSLALAGMRGKCREAFLGALHLEDGDNVLASVGEGIRGIFEQDEKKTMVQANGAFVDGRFEFQEVSYIISLFFCVSYIRIVE